MTTGGEPRSTTTPTSGADDATDAAADLVSGSDLFAHARPDHADRAEPTFVGDSSVFVAMPPTPVDAAAVAEAVTPTFLDDIIVGPAVRNPAHDVPPAAEPVASDATSDEQIVEVTPADMIAEDVIADDEMAPDEMAPDEIAPDELMPQAIADNGRAYDGASDDGSSNHDRVYDDRVYDDRVYEELAIEELAIDETAIDGIAAGVLTADDVAALPPVQVASTSAAPRVAADDVAPGSDDLMGVRAAPARLRLHGSGPAGLWLTLFAVLGLLIAAVVGWQWGSAVNRQASQQFDQRATAVSTSIGTALRRDAELTTAARGS